jgi:hypothetical protein
LGLTRPPTTTSARTAAERFAHMVARRKCVIVTKLDLLMADDYPLLPEEREFLDQLKRGETVPPGREREVLIRWLSDKNALPVERDFAHHLDNVEVFFIWTEGLDDSSPGALPQTYGLLKFVSWCLAGRFAPKPKQHSKKA